MSLLEANEFKVRKKMESLSLKSGVLRLDFLDTSDALLAYIRVTKGTQLITANDAQGMELFHLQGMNGEASLPTDPMCLFDASGNRLAQAKFLEKGGMFKRPKLAWEDNGLVLLSSESSRGKIALDRENNTLATIEIKGRGLSPFYKLQVRVSPNADRKDHLLILGMIWMLNPIIM
ncbi:MAG TPA: hypothetical protein VJN71_11480 [Nitrososphaerales archaeon]|nr:hypothetical protein [Nitrososphaerales archaeon]